MNRKTYDAENTQLFETNKTIKIRHKNRKDFVSSHTQKTCGPNLIYF